jgi:hypothetical protein
MKTKIIFQNQHYCACVLADWSLVVTSKHKQKGRRLLFPESREWIEAIKLAVDPGEANKLCKGMLGGMA